VVDGGTAGEVRFDGLFREALIARFDQPDASSDGGAVLLRQRIFAIACGYEDGNDASRLWRDPVQKLLVGRDPVAGVELASQATLSRFENSVTARELLRMAIALTDRVIGRHRRRLRGRAKRITIDVDGTDDKAYGGQQGALWNGFYGVQRYLPLLGTLQFGREADQYLVAGLLRPGNANARTGAIRLLRRLVPRLAEPLLKRARLASNDSGESERCYGHATDQARSWSCARRVVIKGKVARYPGLEPRDNARLVNTNITADPQVVYQRIYAQRGDMENRLKELHLGIAMDRLFCTRFLANQARPLRHAARPPTRPKARDRANRQRATRPRPRARHPHDRLRSPQQQRRRINTPQRHPKPLETPNATQRNQRHDHAHE